MFTQYLELLKNAGEFGRLCTELHVVEAKIISQKRKKSSAPAKKTVEKIAKTSEQTEEVNQQHRSGRYTKAELATLTDAAKDMGFEDFADIPKNRHDEFAEREEVVNLGRGAKSILMFLHKKKTAGKEDDKAPKAKEAEKAKTSKASVTEPEAEAEPASQTERVVRQLVEAPMETPKSKKGHKHRKKGHKTRTPSQKTPSQ